MSLRQQAFTSPGTWTHPGSPTLLYVDVLLVGGGGAKQTIPQAAPAAPYEVAGGGGGIRLERGVPVSAPVPVTIGAGGTAPSISGGTSSFGPVSVDGGGGGKTAAPTSGGGAGGGQYTPGVTASQAPGSLYAGGEYGNPFYLTPFSGTGGAGGFFSVMYNSYGLGAGGGNPNGNRSSYGYGTNMNRVVANTGAGATIGGTNTNGASGIVVVRWFE